MPSSIKQNKISVFLNESSLLGPKFLNLFYGKQIESIFFTIDAKI